MSNYPVKKGRGQSPAFSNGVNLDHTLPRHRCQDIDFRINNGTKIAITLDPLPSPP